jgi:predicted helicase
LIPNLERGKKAIFEPGKITIIAYRSFFKQRFYNGDKMIHRKGQFQEFFPLATSENKIICVSSTGASNGLSVLITDTIADLHYNGDTQCFPLYIYEERSAHSPGLFDQAGQNEFIRRDGISDFIFDRAQKLYGKTVNKQDIFYYVYGLLHSRDYRETFANDLKKMLPRLPLLEDVRDFWKFSKAGQELTELHIDYEQVLPYAGVVVKGRDSGHFLVDKMKFPKKNEKDCIIYNPYISVENIPAKAYEYTVNGKSAIEWIMERYQVSTHKESGIVNDPNDWAVEVGKPAYILDLLLSIITVSVRTVEIVEGLPKLDFSTL